MAKKWKRVEDGLYQRVDDGVPQNVYIDRISTVSEKGNRHVVGWMFCWKLQDGYDSYGEHWGTLREAKASLEDAKGVK